MTDTGRIVIRPVGQGSPFTVGSNPSVIVVRVPQIIGTGGGGGGGGVTDHGALTGLGDDDHSQYHNNTRGDARYRKLSDGVPSDDVTFAAGTYPLFEEIAEEDVVNQDQANHAVELGLFSVATDLTSVQGDLGGKADISSPALTGAPTAPTAAPGTNTTQIATTAFTQAAVTAAIDDLIDGAPGALDTLNELAAAINDDASFAAAVTTALAGKVPTTRTLAGLDLSTDRTAAALRTALNVHPINLGSDYVGPPIDAYTATAAAQTINLVYYFEIDAVDADTPISTAWTEFTVVAAGNWAAGLYRADTGAKILETAATAIPGAAGLASASVTGGPVTVPGGVPLVVAIGSSVTGVTWRGLGTTNWYGTGTPRFGSQTVAASLALPSSLPSQTALARRPLVTFT